MRPPWTWCWHEAYPEVDEGTAIAMAVAGGHGGLPGAAKGGGDADVSTGHGR